MWGKKQRYSNGKSEKALHEIQQPKRKKILINYERLKELLGFDSYEQVKSVHKKWVESRLSDGDKFRDGEWTESIAAGSEAFIQNIKVPMVAWPWDARPLKPANRFN